MNEICVRMERAKVGRKPCWIAIFAGGGRLTITQGEDVEQSIVSHLAKNGLLGCNKLNLIWPEEAAA